MRHPLAVGAVAGLAIAALNATVAAAAIPDDGVFLGCVDRSGNLRLIDPAASGRAGECVSDGPRRHRERQVSWREQGQPGPPGEPGPQFVVNAVVNADGSVLTGTVPAGISLTVSRTAPGAYLVKIAGMGNSCPVPTANAFAQTFMFLNGGSCGGGSVTTTVQTGDRQDHPFALLAAGSSVAAPTAARAGTGDAQSLPES